MEDRRYYITIYFASNLTEEEAKEKIEQAMNTACCFLEQNTDSPRSISYRIKE
jgi:hypothetical protein